MVDFQGSINKLLNISAAAAYLGKEQKQHEYTEAHKKTEQDARVYYDTTLEEDGAYDKAKVTGDLPENNITDTFNSTPNSILGYKKSIDNNEAYLKEIERIADKRYDTKHPNKQASAASNAQAPAAAPKDDIGKQSEAMAKSTNQIDAKVNQSMNFESVKQMIANKVPRTFNAQHNFGVGNATPNPNNLVKKQTGVGFMTVPKFNKGGTN